MQKRPKEITGYGARLLRWGTVAFLVGSAVLMMLDSFTRRVSEREGSVLAFQNVTTDTGAVRTIAVRLDTGETVHAKYEGYVVVAPGQRVVVAELESGLLGVRRYQFSRHLSPHAGADVAITDGAVK